MFQSIPEGLSYKLGKVVDLLTEFNHFNIVQKKCNKPIPYRNEIFQEAMHPFFTEFSR